MQESLWSHTKFERLYRLRELDFPVMDPNICICFGVRYTKLRYTWRALTKDLDVEVASHFGTISWRIKLPIDRWYINGRQQSNGHWNEGVLKMGIRSKVKHHRTAVWSNFSGCCQLKAIILDYWSALSGQRTDDVVSRAPGWRNDKPESEIPTGSSRSTIVKSIYWWSNKCA